MVFETKRNGFSQAPAATATVAHAPIAVAKVDGRRRSWHAVIRSKCASGNAEQCSTTAVNGRNQSNSPPKAIRSKVRR